MTRIDPHSFAEDTEPKLREVELDLEVGFDARRLSGKARLMFDGPPRRGLINLDTRGLDIEVVLDPSGNICPFRLSDPDPIKGECLTITTRSDRLEIRYKTGPDATALQWLHPEQTAGGTRPFVFTQCQATHARSVFPCQDTPRRRITYRCRLTVPSELRAVMAARFDRRLELEDGRSIFEFTMAQPIPPYLFAFAVGDLVHKDLGPRSAVFAEPATIEAAAWEFQDVDEMLTTAESLFGPYDWERFDLLVMPPSFPYGGMENPRLTFLTPSLLAGDRSLVNVLAHELAHSWTGNLVTNATMNDFWLNEGFTTFAERRILEALEGPVQLSLHTALGRRGLESDVARFGADSPVTRLRNDLEGVDPDQVYSRVPYEKGYLFLARIEELIGRDAFDGFLKAYISSFRFQSITTEEFLSFLKKELPGIETKIDLLAWIDRPGIPSDAPAGRSEVLDQVEAAAKKAAAGVLPADDAVAKWGPSEWQVFYSSLPRELPRDLCSLIEQRYQASHAKNYEIRVAWLSIAARSGFTPAFPAVRETLMHVGRMKFLRPLYVGLIGAGGEALTVARETFALAKGRYHPVARAVIEPLIARGSTREEAMP